ncbi:MAG TPA: EamA family transporter [archaeon]|nr:EamA family transporter [archaeon]
MDKRYWLAIVPVAAFGSMGLVVRMVGLNGLQTTFFASLASAAFFSLLLLRKGMLFNAFSKRGTKYVVALGAAGALNNVSYFYAYNLTTISNAVFSHYLAPVLVLFLAPLVVGERVKRRAWAFLFMALSGLGILLAGNLNASSNHLLGIAAGALSAVGFAFGVLLPKKLAGEYEPKELVFAQMVFTSLILLPFILYSPPSLEQKDLAPLLLLGVFYQGVNITWFFKAVQLLPAQRVAVITYLEPVVATLLAALFLNETPGALTLVGGSFILLACYMATRK